MSDAHALQEYLDQLVNFERVHRPQAMRRVRLDRMLRLCGRLGDPQRRFRTLLVAGTNGKGSICAMLYAILRAAGLRVGLYTSPHLQDARERIRVTLPGAAPRDDADGADWIAPAAFMDAISRVRAAADARNAPTYFEVLTAAALLHFADSRVELAVVEVGLGGRLDATNVTDPAVSILAPIGLDHMDVLGKDERAIAREKAGIIRPGRTVISARQQPAVATLLRELAGTANCRFLECGREIAADVLAHTPQGLRVSLRGLRGCYEDVAVPFLGRHQADNAAVAVAAVESLSECGVPHGAVQRGLARSRWPGRLELIEESPVVLLDGAHNAPAAEAVRAALAELWPDRRLHLLVGMSADKPVEAVASILGPAAASVTCATSRHPRACDAERVAQAYRRSATSVTVVPDALDAYTYVLNTAAAQDVILVTGSLFLVGEVRAALRNSRAQRRTTRARRPRSVAASS